MNSSGQHYSGAGAPYLQWSGQRLDEICGGSPASIRWAPFEHRGKRQEHNRHQQRSAIRQSRDRALWFAIRHVFIVADFDKACATMTAKGLGRNSRRLTLLARRYACVRFELLRPL
jgi:hypothetical protein